MPFLRNAAVDSPLPRRSTPLHPPDPLLYYYLYRTMDHISDGPFSFLNLFLICFFFSYRVGTHNNIFLISFIDPPYRSNIIYIYTHTPRSAIYRYTRYSYRRFAMNYYIIIYIIYIDTPNDSKRAEDCVTSCCRRR